MDYKPRRKLTREFKLEAVRQVALSEKPEAQVARGVYALVSCERGGSSSRRRR